MMAVGTPWGWRSGSWAGKGSGVWALVILVPIHVEISSLRAGRGQGPLALESRTEEKEGNFNKDLKLVESVADQ